MITHKRNFFRKKLSKVWSAFLWVGVSTPLYERIIVVFGIIQRSGWLPLTLLSVITPLAIVFTTASVSNQKIMVGILRGEVLFPADSRASNNCSYSLFWGVSHTCNYTVCNSKYTWV